MPDKEEIYDITIDENMAGTRIDLVLSLSLADTSRSYLQKLITRGLVKINGDVCSSKKLKVETGDVVRVTVPEPEELKIEAENIPLDIVYEDSDVLVVNKPKGMVVHPAAGNYTGTLVNAVMYHCGDSLSSINGVIRPGIVHRIDKDTSGLLMIAKNDNAHRSLAAQLAAHSSTRGYKAIVYNAFSEDEGTVDKPIGRSRRNRLKQAVGGLNEKEAVTHYKVLERLGKYTFLELRLETGRTHQIRVHMTYINHPLLGDGVYGPVRNPFGVEGQLLHAYLLGFIHPTTGEYMEFRAELPAEFAKVLNRLRTTG
ncbi:MAG: RluA family pseudouridine synthase [Eubacteriaceae bacterium]|nr:RluA family pseudouridine synthase [Eubacteriaceae bacterium]